MSDIDVGDILLFLQRWKADNDENLLDKISLGVAKGLKEYSKEQDIRVDEKINIHGLDCPARRNMNTAKWFLTIPILSPVVLYFVQKWIAK